MSRILLVGSEGTIGKPLVRKLRTYGHEVFTADIKHQFDGTADDYQEYYTRCDISEYRQLARLLSQRDYDYIYFLAAEFGRINGEHFYEQVWKTNVIGVKNLLTYYQNASTPTPKIIFSSSSEIYGDLVTQDGDLKESDPDHYPIHLTNDYAISKHVNEMQIKNAIARNPNIQILTMRFFNAYGPEEYYHAYRSVVCLFCYRALHNMPVTIFQNYHRVFMYVDDLVTPLAHIVDKHWDTLKHQTINIGGEEYCSVEHMFDVIKQHVPNYSGEVVILPEDRHNVVNKRPNIDRAKLLLGHNPTITLETGIPKTLEWMEKTYNVSRI